MVEDGDRHNEWCKKERENEKKRQPSILATRTRQPACSSQNNPYNKLLHSISILISKETLCGTRIILMFVYYYDYTP